MEYPNFGQLDLIFIVTKCVSPKLCGALVLTKATQDVCTDDREGRKHMTVKGELTQSGRLRYSEALEPGCIDRCSLKK